MDSAAASAARPLPIRDLLSLTKPSVTALNLVAVAAGFWLARPHGTSERLLWTLAGTALVVGAANALNCYLEREVDRRMARTRLRPLPAGRMRPRAALGFGLLLGAVGVALLILRVNMLSAFIAALALVVYAAIYTPLKQRSSFALLVGAIPGAAPPLIGWAAATSALASPGLLLSLLLFLWQVPHFLAITLYRKAEYADAGLRILPLESGEALARTDLFSYLLATIATSLALAAAGVAGGLYLAVALLLGAGILARGLEGLRPAAGARWARSFFLATNLYLALLMGALAIDRL